MDVYVNVAAGTHTLKVLGQNSKGQNFSLARSITVSGRDSSSCANRGIGPVRIDLHSAGGSVTGTSIHVVGNSTGIQSDCFRRQCISTGKRFIQWRANREYLCSALCRIATTLWVQSTDSLGFSWSSTVYVDCSPLEINLFPVEIHCRRSNRIESGPKLPTTCIEVPSHRAA